MKKLLLLSLVSLLSVDSFAQSHEGRLAKTVVADVLGKMPAQSINIFNNQMRDMSLSGAEGVDILCSMMKAPLSKDNQAIEYAISGLARYVTTPGMEDARAMVTASLIKALDKATDREIKAYFIRQIEISSTTDGIATLQKYALSNDLYEEAVRALSMIDTQESRAAIVEVATKVKDKDVVAQVVAECEIMELEPLMVKWFRIDDSDIHASVVRALVAVKSEAGLDLLAKEAKSVGYQYEQYEITSAFAKLLAAIPSEKSAKYAELLNKKSDNASIRKQAMLVLLKAEPDDATSLVVKAMDDEDQAYRNGVLALCCSFDKVEVAGKLVAQFDEYPVDTQSDIINWATKASVSIPEELIVAAANSIDSSLSRNSIKYLVASGTSQSIDILIDLLVSTDNTELAENIGSEMLWSDFTNFTDQHYQAIENSSNIAKIVVLEFLSNRKVGEMMPFVVALTSASDVALKSAAYKALATTASEGDVQSLFSMLNGADDMYVSDIQNAITQQLKMLDQDSALTIIDKNLSGSDKARIYALYSAIPTKSAISILTNSLKTEAPEAKSAIIDALCKWENKDAITPLYDAYCGAQFVSQQDVILSSSLTLINKSKMSDAWKFIMLRRLMDATKSGVAQNKILNSIAKCKSFNALIYVAPFMENKETAARAMQAVMSIALKDKTYEFYGANVEKILTRFIELRTGGGDASYEREGVATYIKNAPGAGIGFASIFNGADLSGWKGLVKNPIARSKMSATQFAQAQKVADGVMSRGWKVEDGVLIFTGKGDNLCTDKKYGDFEMYVDWKIEEHGDAGIYLRGVPQVQIWDTSLVKVGAQVGSGGLYNNSTNPSIPLVVADNAVGEWNTFYIKMVGERVTVELNGQKVVDNVIMENYWKRSTPILLEEQIELQAHGNLVAYRDIYIKELEKVEPLAMCDLEVKEGFKYLFDGTSMSQWMGNTKDYTSVDGSISLDPRGGGGGNLYTKKEYSDFIYRFEFQLSPNANNGLGIRTPSTGDPAYHGIELQILDSESPVYKNIELYQFHGSVYGIIPAKRGFLKPTGEWNVQEVIADGDNIKVTLNGEVILEGNIRDASKGGSATLDGQKHPGLFNKSGHIGFLGHGYPVKFRNIRIKELN